MEVMPNIFGNVEKILVEKNESSTSTVTKRVLIY